MQRKHKTYFVIGLFLILVVLLCTTLRQTTHLRAMLRSMADYSSAAHMEETTMVTTTTEMPVKPLREILQCNDQKLEEERLQYGSYWLLRNFIRGTLSTDMGCAESITYTTIGDYTFSDNIATLAMHWLAPISFALFAPGYDFKSTLDSIQYIRNCLPESDLITQYVTFHIYFPAAHMPDSIPMTGADALNRPYNCSEPAPYEDVDHEDTYKSQMNLTYPINVGRNIARKAANTYFIFASDIELLPSSGLAQSFLEMVRRNESTVFDGETPRVFPLPIFELDKNAVIPRTKAELVQLLRKKKALPFHSKICIECHKVPKQDEWVNATSDSTDLTVFSVGKRYDRLRFWEPFYISDNKEPMFDERVHWEGQKNKRIQNYAMCLLNYEYHVLHPAFLVHRPGIKRFVQDKTRLKFVNTMNRLISRTIEPEYKKLYGVNKKCIT